MKKRTGNHTKAAVAAFALTAVVMAPAMTMINTRGAEPENSSVSLEENAVWTDEANFRAEFTVKIRGLDEIQTDSAQEMTEPDQDLGNDVQDEESVELENSQDADEDEIQMQEYFLITYISEYFQPDIDALSEQTQAEPVAVVNQKGESTEIIRLTSMIDTEKMEEGETSLSFPVSLREEYRTPEEDMMYSVIQEEPLQKDQPGAASYLQVGTGEEAQILAEGESPVLHVRATQQTSEEPSVTPAEDPEPTQVPDSTEEPEPDPSQTPKPAKDPTETPSAVPTEIPKTTPTPRPTSTPVPSPTVSQTGVNGFGINSGVTPTPVSDPVSYQSSGYDSQTGTSYKTASKPATGDQAETGLSVVLLLFAAMSGIGAFARLKGKNER